MKTNFLITAFLFLSLEGPASFAQPDNCLRKFSWLAGNWSMVKNGTTTVEMWKQTPSAMECSVYEISGKDSVLAETTTITCVAGKHVFTYNPVLKDANDHRKPVYFALVSEANDVFVFENKEHDFPQRVVYQKKGDNECQAWIEGTENGELKKFEFPYQRTQ